MALKNASHCRERARNGSKAASLTCLHKAQLASYASIIARKRAGNILAALAPGSTNLPLGRYHRPCDAQRWSKQPQSSLQCLPPRHPAHPRRWPVAAAATERPPCQHPNDQTPSWCIQKQQLVRSVGQAHKKSKIVTSTADAPASGSADRAGHNTCRRTASRLTLE